MKTESSRISKLRFSLLVNYKTNNAPKMRNFGNVFAEFKNCSATTVKRFEAKSALK